MQNGVHNISIRALLKNSPFNVETEPAPMSGWPGGLISGTVDLSLIPTFAILRNKKHIQKLLASWLLAVFILCNTPTVVLHYFFANHHDNPTFVEHGDSPQFHEAGIDCHLISNVVNTPYLWTLEPQLLHPLSFRVAADTPAVVSLYLSPTQLRSSRGPPGLS